MPPGRPEVEAFLHAPSSAWGYVVHDGHAAAVIDPALSLDTASGAVAAPVARDMADFVKAHGLRVEWILETHAHADHLTAAAWLQQRVGGRTAIGEGIREVQAAFADLLDFEPGFRADGSQFDRLLGAGERLAIGSLQVFGQRDVPGWLQSDQSAFRVTVIDLPVRTQIDAPVTEQMIVELYSK